VVEKGVWYEVPEEMLDIQGEYLPVTPVTEDERERRRKQMYFNIAVRWVRGEGVKHIARVFGIKEHTVKAKILPSPLFKAMVERINEHIIDSVIPAKDRLQQLQELAVKQYEEAMAAGLDEADYNVKIRAANEVLDRSGIPSVKATEISTEDNRVTKAYVEMLKKRAEMAKVCSVTVEQIEAPVKDGELVGDEGEEPTDSKSAGSSDTEAADYYRDIEDSNE